MSEETPQPIEQKPDPDIESKVGGVSIRGWIVSVLVLTICAQSLAFCILSYMKSGEVPGPVEPLYSLSVAAVSYYFGKQQSKAV
jgi:hypothetical protein